MICGNDSSFACAGLPDKHYPGRRSALSVPDLSPILVNKQITSGVKLLP